MSLLKELPPLGMWSSFAAANELPLDLFELSLAVDFALVEEKTELDYRDVKITIVEPNFYIGGQLFDIIRINSREDEEALIAKLKELSKDILHKELMTSSTTSLTARDRANILRYGKRRTHIHSSFSHRSYSISVSYDEDNGYVFSINERHYGRNEKDENPKFGNHAALVDYIVSKAEEDYFYCNHRDILNIFTSGHGPRHTYAGLREDFTIKTLFDTKINIGPLYVTYSKDEVDGRDITVANITINGVGVSPNVLYDYKSREALDKIFSENKSRVLLYKYKEAIMEAIFSNNLEFLKAESQFEKIQRKIAITNLMSQSMNVNVKVEDFNETLFSLRNRLNNGESRESLNDVNHNLNSGILIAGNNISRSKDYYNGYLVINEGGNYGLFKYDEEDRNYEEIEEAEIGVF